MHGADAADEIEQGINVLMRLVVPELFRADIQVVVDRMCRLLQESLEGVVGRVAHVGNCLFVAVVGCCRLLLLVVAEIQNVFPCAVSFYAKFCGVAHWRI